MTTTPRRLITDPRTQRLIAKFPAEQLEACWKTRKLCPNLTDVEFAAQLRALNVADAEDLTEAARWVAWLTGDDKF